MAQHTDPAAGPRRILALDGASLRGVLTPGMLRGIEAQPRTHHGDDRDFRPGDGFGLSAGTSADAIIAAALSLGRGVDEVHGH